MVKKICDRCGEPIMPPDPRTQATTQLRVVVSDPRYVTLYAPNLCYKCQREVFFFVDPAGTWFNGTDYVKKEEKE